MALDLSLSVQFGERHGGPCGGQSATIVSGQKLFSGDVDGGASFGNPWSRRVPAASDVECALDGGQFQAA
jgi:hypothetical protein